MSLSPIASRFATWPRPRHLSLGCPVRHDFRLGLPLLPHRSFVSAGVQSSSLRGYEVTAVVEILVPRVGISFVYCCGAPLVSFPSLEGDAASVLALAQHRNAKNGILFRPGIIGLIVPVRYVALSEYATVVTAPAIILNDVDRYLRVVRYALSMPNRNERAQQHG